MTFHVIFRIGAIRGEEKGQISGRLLSNLWVGKPMCCADHETEERTAAENFQVQACKCCRQGADHLSVKHRNEYGPG